LLWWNFIPPAEPPTTGSLSTDYYSQLNSQNKKYEVVLLPERGMDSHSDQDVPTRPIKMVGSKRKKTNKSGDY